MPHDLSSRDAVSVVLPVYRNRAHLPELVARLRPVLEALRRPWRVVFVDDSGHDGSREWIAEQAASDTHLSLVANPRNLGQHASILRGLAAIPGGVAIVMDADLQDAPEELPQLIAAWRPGLGAVFAQRSLAYQPATRDWTGRQFKRLLRRLTGEALPSGVGTFVLIGDEARRALLELADSQPYLPLLIARTGLPLATVEVEKRKRLNGDSDYSTGRRIALAIHALRHAARWRLGRR